MGRFSNMIRYFNNIIKKTSLNKVTCQYYSKLIVNGIDPYTVDNNFNAKQVFDYIQGSQSKCYM